MERSEQKSYPKVCAKLANKRIVPSVALYKVTPFLAACSTTDFVNVPF